MTRRIQIPIEVEDEARLKIASARRGLTLAEWSRRVLRSEADRELGEQRESAEDALRRIFSLEAPVSSVDDMILESTEGRYR